MDFSHLDASGAPRMVDVSAKTESKRTAIARSVVHISASTLELLKAKALPKGDVLTVAQIAGIMAAKRTSEFIPMCHPLGGAFPRLCRSIRSLPLHFVIAQ